MYGKCHTPNIESIPFKIKNEASGAIHHYCYPNFYHTS